jgi:hypothetical protein
VKSLHKTGLVQRIHPAGHHRLWDAHLGHLISIRPLPVRHPVMAHDEEEPGKPSLWTGTVNDLVAGAAVADMIHIKMLSDRDLYRFETVSSNNRIETIPVMGRE